MNVGSTYPVDLDHQTSGQVRSRVGISPTYKPSKDAISAAFRAHSSNPYTRAFPRFLFLLLSFDREIDCQRTLTWTAGDFDAISLSNPLNALMNDKFQQLVQIRRSNDRVGWAGAEQHCFTGNGAGQPLDKKAARAADKEEKTAAETNATPVRPFDNAPVGALTSTLTRLYLCTASERPDGLAQDGKQLSAAGLLVPHPPLCHVPSVLPQLLQALRHDHHGPQAVRLRQPAVPVPADPTRARTVARGERRVSPLQL